MGGGEPTTESSVHTDGMSGRVTALPRALRRGVVWMVAVLGVGAGGLVLWRTVGEGVDAGLPTPPMLAAAAVAYAVGMIFYSHAWAVLLSDPKAEAPLRLRFLVSQPAKYIPGGFAQPLGQVLVSADVSRSRVRPSVAFPVHAVENVVAAGLLASPLAFWSGGPGWVRVLSGLGPLTLLLLYRPFLMWVVRLLARVIRREVNPASLPSQPIIFHSLPFAVLAHGFMALAFGLVASSAIDVPLLTLAGVYVAAWVVGYVAVPFPAGVGAREVTLLFLLTGLAPTSLVLAITVIHRVLTIVVELALMGGAMFRLGAYRTARYES